MAREKHLCGSGAMQAMLVGIAGNTWRVCWKNSWALCAKPGGIACNMRWDCLLFGWRLLVTVANYRCYLPKVGSYVRQVALCG